MVIFLDLGSVIYIEIVLNDNEELLHTMIECGILDNLVDIMTSEDRDSGTLV